MARTSLVVADPTRDVNLDNVWFVELTYAAGDVTQVVLHFSDTTSITLTGEAARDYARFRALLPALRDAEPVQ
jgi:hypothetical protein